MVLPTTEKAAMLLPLQNKLNLIVKQTGNSISATNKSMSANNKEAMFRTRQAHRGDFLAKKDSALANLCDKRYSQLVGKQPSLNTHVPLSQV